MKTLLEKSLEKMDNCYSEINGVKHYHYTSVIATIKKDGETISYTITRSLRPSDPITPVYHLIRRDAIKDGWAKGNGYSKLYRDDESFAKAINRIQKMLPVEGRFTEVAQLDICYPDYFTGYHMPVLQVPVYNGMTTHNLAQDIMSEINASWEMFVGDGEEVSDKLFTKEEMEIFVKFCDNLLMQPLKIFIKHNTFQNGDDDLGCCYAYFSLCKPVTNYGITFLNA